jgi:protein TonB
MALRKNPKADLKLHYKRVIEISMMLSITLVIAAFKIFPDRSNETSFVNDVQDVFTIEDAVRTEQRTTPPSPPQPPVPIEAPGDIDIPDVEISTTELDPYAEVNTPIRPPVVNIHVEEEIPPFFEVVEQQPSPVGGIQALYENLQYPPFAIKAGIQGKVKIYAYVDKNGDVVKTELIKGIGMGCDEEAMNAVNKLKFNPGMQRGKPVNVKVAMEIKFVLQ